jgi:hypothetical protein
MSFGATVYRVLIASPSDLGEEREVVTHAINDWNAQHAIQECSVLLPVRWETHATPKSGVRPQEAINNQLAKNSDILVGMFWTKLGTKTGVADSGTVEEIDLFVAAKKPALLYFSERPIAPGKINLQQHKKLRKFKDQTYKNALTGSFASPEELRQALLRDLLSQVRELNASRKGTEVPTLTSIELERHTLELKQRIAGLSSALGAAEEMRRAETSSLSHKLLQAESNLKNAERHTIELGEQLTIAKRGLAEAEIIRQHAKELAVRLEDAHAQLKDAGFTEQGPTSTHLADQWRNVELQLQSIAKEPLGRENLEALHILARDGQANDAYVLRELRSKGLAQGSIAGFFEGLSSRTNLLALAPGQGDRMIRSEMKTWTINPDLRKLVLHYFAKQRAFNSQASR